MRSLVLSVWVVLALGAFSNAAFKPCAHKVKETIQPPRGWIKSHPAAPDAIIELRIALPQRNFAQLERHLYEVSDPFHERYGIHLSKEEVEELVSPHPDSIDIVNEWLASHGLSDEHLTRSPAKDWVRVKVPVSLAEEMMDTKYHVWTNSKDGNTIVRTTSYSLPESLHDHIELVQPTTLFSTLRTMKTTFRIDKDVPEVVNANAPPIQVPSASGGLVDASCNTTITITCLKQLYNAVGFTPTGKNNQIGITGYLGENANIADLQAFFADQVPAAVGSNFTFISVAGGINNQSIAAAGAEANLDTQFAYGLTHPIPATFWSTAGSPPFIPDLATPTNTNEPYTDWLDFVLGHPNPPQTISTSYADDEQTVPVNFAKRVCQGFAQLGARGVSLTFSSGDGGVGDGETDPAETVCISNDGKNKTEFLPLFPPSCPFVTAVGGTIGVPETAVFFSGGGFSNLFPRPSYQAVAVPTFLGSLPKGLYKGLFNPNGRAIPDVAAQADRFRIFLSGFIVSIGGTSAAAPTFAGFVSLLNDARISNGLPPLGFLNPLLYTIPEAFNDITTGSNPGCGTPGFNATKGWDPVTGLGTPNFGKLKDIVTKRKFV
ncbi:tripeptidyl peptidase A [Abortiporus biennis]|nr:tripeptidyl peptidase A [Abortiporus biennis]